MRRQVIPQVQTTTKTNAPPAWIEDIFKKASSEALNLYNSGSGGNVYQGERAADLSDTTKNAIMGLEKAADQYNNPIIAQLLNAPTNSVPNLLDMAQGNFVGRNSKFNDALQNALNQTSDAVNRSVSGAGRYGSGAHTGVLADELGMLATKAAARQYNQDVNNMINANKIIDNSLYDKVNAANGYYKGQSSAQSNALKGGIIKDEYRQNALDVERQKWIEQDNRGWNRLAQLLQAGKQTAGNYGTNSTETTAMPSMVGDPLRDVQQLVGLLGGLFGLSDMRSKENIVPVGEKNGYPIYAFNYKGDPQRYCGVLAQEVLRLNPEAVYMNAKTKLLHVDYSTIGFQMKKIGASRNKISSFFLSLFARFLKKGHIL
ncbi:tail fiber domain-containing protein [Bartonella sp. B41]